MEYESLHAARMIGALHRLDELLPKPVQLIVGGGGAMILAHGFPLATSDIDAIPKGMDMVELDPFVKQVARELNLAPDWLNPWFSTFSHTLPSDYARRLVPIFQGNQIEAQALGATDLLIMKCFAHRQKDVGHSKALIKKGADLEFVRAHMSQLEEKRIPGASAALDFLDDLEDHLEVHREVK
jgi:hypothetical protein